MRGDTLKLGVSTNDSIVQSHLHIVRANSGGYLPISQTQYFICELCDFSIDSERSLNCHITRKHTKIDQLDGNVSLIETDEDSSNYKREMKEDNVINNNLTVTVTEATQEWFVDKNNLGKNF